MSLVKTGLMIVENNRHVQFDTLCLYAVHYFGCN